MIFLSIIIPCYNVEKYLPTTIRSLSQLKNLENCEFIFINDGSTDSTLSIIQDFVKQNSSAILIDQPNQGVSVARNSALQKVRGEYILCLDGDDYLDSNAINIIRSNVQGNDLLIAPCIKDNLNNFEYCSLNIHNGQYSVNKLYEVCKVFPLAPQLVYRTDIIKKNNLLFNSQIKCGEVYDFTVSFLRYVKNIKVIDQAFYYYVIRESSATRKVNYEADLSVLTILDNFAVIPNEWALSKSFLLTELRLIINFTYKKYVRNALMNKDTLNVVDIILSDCRFKNLLSLLSVKSLSLKDRVYVSFFKYVPFKIGYFIAIFLQKIIKF